MAQNEALSGAADLEQAYDLMKNGSLYALIVMERTTLDQVVFDLIDGWIAVFFPGKGDGAHLLGGH